MRRDPHSLNVVAVQSRLSVNADTQIHSAETHLHGVTLGPRPEGRADGGVFEPFFFLTTISLCWAVPFPAEVAGIM